MPLREPHYYFLVGLMGGKQIRVRILTVLSVYHEEDMSELRKS